MADNKRIKEILKRQEALKGKVANAQQALYKLLLESLDRIEKDPAYLEAVFKKYQQSEGVKLVSALATDVSAIATLNYEYFLSYKDELNLNGKDFSVIKSKVDDFIKDRIGLSGNKVTANGFLEAVLKNDTVKQKVQQKVYQSLLAGDGLDTFKANVKNLVLGEGNRSGVLEGHFNTFAYDTYNSVDSALQDKYAVELGLTAFVYEGGLMDTSRDFCIKKAGKVFLKEEALEKWPDEIKEAKPDNYQPLIHRGGYRCRHHINYITSARAMRMRKDLELVDGKLRVKA